MKPARVPEGMACYAVGDIHGRLDLFETLIGDIEHDMARHGLDSRIILLGDYVDRGPSSRGVIDAILALQDRHGERLVPLMGNHEQAMNDFLANAGAGPIWAQHGGRETLLSYGVAVSGRQQNPEEWEGFRVELDAAMPQSHKNLLSNLQYFATFGDYVFVHAGVRPGVLLEEQDPQDLLWIRDDFLKSGRAIAQTVVHGHTPSAVPILSEGRIGIDTGAYATGVLTSVKLIEDKVDLLQVSRR